MTALTDDLSFRLRDMDADGDVREDPAWCDLLGIEHDAYAIEETADAL